MVMVPVNISDLLRGRGGREVLPMIQRKKRRTRARPMKEQQRLALHFFFFLLSFLSSFLEDFESQHEEEEERAGAGALSETDLEDKYVVFR